MRILLVGHTRFPIRVPFAGGLESATWQLAGALHRQGHQVTVFASPDTDCGDGVEVINPDPLRLPARSDEPLASADHVEIHHAYLQLMLRVSRSAEFDLVHNHSLHYLPVAMGGAVGAPILTTLHTPPIAWLESAFQLAPPRARNACAVSAFTAASWDHVVDADVVHNGVDTDLWSYGDGGEDLVWTGRLVPEKAPHLAIRIARRAGRRLRIAGPVSDQAYFDRAIRPELRDGIEYVGHLGGDDLVQLVGASAVALVTPVWDEPFGLVAAEAMACGTPVVGFARGGLPEVVGLEGGLVVAPGDVAAAASAIDTVAAMSRHLIRQSAVRRFSLSRMVGDYLRIYRRTLLAGGEYAAADTRTHSA